jgi:hypothetical protein
MAKISSAHLYELIKSMTTAEKRYFKMYVRKSNKSADLKYIKLFDYIDKHKKYDEKKINKDISEIKESQISNLKSHLYDAILESLANYNPEEEIEIKIRKKLNYANILYNRALYEQCWRVLQKGKQLAIEFDKILLLYELTEFEKKLLTKNIEKDIQTEALSVIQKSEQLVQAIKSSRNFQNLSLKLYSHYLQIGFIRNSQDFEIANRFLYSSLPAFNEEKLTFNEKMFLYQAFTGYYFFVQDNVRAYEFAQKWYGLFQKHKEFIRPKFEYYIKAFNNLVSAQFRLFLYDDFVEHSKKFSDLKNIKDFKLTFNHSLMLFKYSATHRINKYFMTGKFTEGTKIIPEINEEFKIYEKKLDAHNRTIFYYKFACMYFGDENYSKAIFWLNKIINTKDVNIRSDIQGFSRILMLISHWELKNTEFVDYYIRSTYRFLKKKQDFHLYQKYLLDFLTQLGTGLPEKIEKAFVTLYKKLKPLLNNPYEKRAFVYFDIISWLESKIYNRSNQEIIQEKAKKRIFN